MDQRPKLSFSGKQAFEERERENEERREREWLFQVGRAGRGKERGKAKREKKERWGERERGKKEEREKRERREGKKGERERGGERKTKRDNRRSFVGLEKDSELIIKISSNSSFIELNCNLVDPASSHMLV